jgi:3-oxoadipate enol-lactonase
MRARCGDVDLYYEMDGRGPPIVLGHSLGMHVTLWQLVAARLADRYTVVRFDARGHGRSDKPPGPYRVDAMAEDVYGLLRALDLERAVVGGLSLGGSLGLALALAHPDLVQALILADTADRFDVFTPEQWEARAQAVEREGMGLVVPGGLESGLSAAFRDSQPDRLEPIIRAYRANDPAAYAATARALAAVDLGADLPRIACPALVLVGEHDPLTPPATARRLALGLPHAELVEVPGARHLSAWEQPDFVANAIGEFLTTCGLTDT